MYRSHTMFSLIVGYLVRWLYHSFDFRSVVGSGGDAILTQGSKDMATLLQDYTVGKPKRDNDGRMSRQTHPVSDVVAYVCIRSSSLRI